MKQPQFSEQDYLEAMENPAVTAISGWTEENFDTKCNEDTYRSHLDENAPILHTKIEEALNIVQNARRSSK